MPKKSIAVGYHVYHDYRRLRLARLHCATDAPFTVAPGPVSDVYRRASRIPRHEEFQCTNVTSRLDLTPSQFWRLV